MKQLAEARDRLVQSNGDGILVTRGDVVPMKRARTVRDAVEQVTDLGDRVDSICIIRARRGSCDLEPVDIMFADLGVTVIIHDLSSGAFGVYPPETVRRMAAAISVEI